MNPSSQGMEPPGVMPVSVLPLIGRRARIWVDAENAANRTVKAPLKTWHQAAPGGISRP